MNPLEILRSRKEKLAKPIGQQELNGDRLEVMVFNLGDESYAIETKYIVEVYPLKEYTPLPCTPPFVYGLTNVRRKILLIIDLKVLFSIPSKEGTDLKRLIILGTEEYGFGILTDGFKEIQKVAKEGLQTSLPTLTGIRGDFLKGLMNDGTVILDGEKLLKSKALVIEDAHE